MHDPLVSRKDIGSSKSKITSWRMEWTEYAGLNLNYLFCAHFRYLVSSFFYILLLIERVMDVPLVSRYDIWSSRKERYLQKDGMMLISKAEPKLLILCPFHITFIIFLLYCSSYWKNHVCYSCVQKCYRITQK